MLSLRRSILSLPPLYDAIRLPYGPAQYQYGDLRLPRGDARPHPLVVVVHGGFWRAAYDLEHIGRLCAALTSAGFATWSVEYRRIGHEGGGWPGTFLDVAAALDYARVLSASYALDADRVTVLGHSAGGHLAVWLAGRRRIPSGSPLHATQALTPRAVVALAPVTDLLQAWRLKLGDSVVQDLMGATPEDAPERYDVASPANLLPLGVAQTLIHGRWDRIVPSRMSKTYVRQARARGDDAVLHLLPWAGHFALIDPRSRAFATVLKAARTSHEP